MKFMSDFRVLLQKASKVTDSRKIRRFPIELNFG